MKDYYKGNGVTAQKQVMRKNNMYKLVDMVEREIGS